MFDQDVVIIGGGPAGLTAGTLLAGAGYRTLLLEKEDFGGYLKKVEIFHGLPDHPDGVSGPEFAEQLIARARESGLTMEFGEVVDIESYSSCESVTCADGKHYTTAAVVIAGGRRPKKLDVPGEKQYLNRGVIHCALCDAALYTGKTVAVCGGGDAGLSEALLMARYAARVIVIERQSALTAMDKLKQLAQAHEKLEFMYDATITKITGTQVVEAVEIKNLKSGDINLVAVDGVVIDIGYLPDSVYLEEVVPLDKDGKVLVSDNAVALQTGNAAIFAAGDIRNGTLQNLAGAIHDGELAAAGVREFLESGTG